jgi:hypothetical protein
MLVKEKHKKKIESTLNYDIKLITASHKVGKTEQK